MLDQGSPTLPPSELRTAPAPATLTPAEAIASARELQPRLIAEAGETEARTFHSEELHLEFCRRGFYHLFRPRMFGGYEFSVTEFMRVVRELAQGDMATAWSVTLGAGHNLQVASWWPEAVQREVFVDGMHFVAPMTVAPGGTLARDGDGWVLNGKFQYASGQAYATHFVGHAIDPSTGGWSTFITPRSTWTVLDDWGTTLGLRGSGSHSLAFTDVHVPDRFVLEGRLQHDMTFEGGSPGLHLHGNPLYNGRTLGFFALELVSIVIGGVRGAIDEFAALMPEKRTFLPPFSLRSEDARYQSWYGAAVSRVMAAEAIADRVGDLIGEYSQREASGGAPFSVQEDHMLNALTYQAMSLCWNVMQDTIFKTAGTSASHTGSRLERVWRDVSQAWGHVNFILHDWTTASYSMHEFGTLPPPPGA
jgi:3-hydroxy-9,10-secoandrosta-1,3,5(10)-triene-9,17-dione monooxygenase